VGHYDAGMPLRECTFRRYSCHASISQGIQCLFTLRQTAQSLPGAPPMRQKKKRTMCAMNLHSTRCTKVSLSSLNSRLPSRLRRHEAGFSGHRDRSVAPDGLALVVPSGRRAALAVVLAQGLGSVVGSAHSKEAASDVNVWGTLT
jgi:hypothetical protein